MLIHYHHIDLIIISYFYLKPILALAGFQCCYKKLALPLMPTLSLVLNYKEILKEKSLQTSKKTALCYGKSSTAVGRFWPRAQKRKFGELLSCTQAVVSLYLNSHFRNENLRLQNTLQLQLPVSHSSLLWDNGFLRLHS